MSNLTNTSLSWSSWSWVCDSEYIYYFIFLGNFLFFFIFFFGFLSFLLYFLFWVSFFNFKRGVGPAIDNPDFYHRNLSKFLFYFIYIFIYLVVKVRVLLFSLTIRTSNVSLFGVGVLIPIVLHV